MINIVNVFDRGLTELTTDGGVNMCRYHSGWALTLITPSCVRAKKCKFLANISGIPTEI